MLHMTCAISKIKFACKKKLLQRRLVPQKLLFPYKEKGGFVLWYFWAYTAVKLEAPKLGAPEGLGGGRQITLKVLLELGTTLHLTLWPHWDNLSRN